MTPFRRWLSDDFMTWLSGAAGRRLLALLGKYQTDVRLRDDSFNAYRAQSSVARVEWWGRQQVPLIKIDPAYLVGTSLLSDDTARRGFDVSDEFLDLYERHLRQITNTIDSEHASPGGLWEAKCVQANSGATPFHIVDRQVVNSQPPLRLDLLAFSVDPQQPAAIAIELKRDSDNRIQDVPDQLAAYLDVLDPGGEGLRADMADSYRRACEQLQTLGLGAPDPSLIHAGMDVVGIVALANYNTRSELLGRALEGAGRLPRRINFCFLPANGAIPAASQWFVAAGS